jgi:flagella basal body P-ring formation protein FlgA
MTATAIIKDSLPTHSDNEITISPLDNRLHLYQCDQALQGFVPPGTKLAGKSTIGIRCNGKKPWKIYITANIARYSDVVVATEHISRGTPIQKHQLMTTKMETSVLSRGYYTSIEQVAGQLAKYDIAKDRTVLPSSITKPKLVKRGKEVTILANSGPITVRMRGQAITDGALGDIIQVKNLRSRKIIQAQVINTNRVQVSM